MMAEFCRSGQSTADNGVPSFFQQHHVHLGSKQSAPGVSVQRQPLHYYPIFAKCLLYPAGQTNGAVSVSSNGTTPGTAIVWATAPTDDPNTSTVGGNLFAFDATNLGNLLWSTTQNPSRDGFGGFSKFVPPTIANGRVYVATNDSPGQIAVYGLLSGGVTLTNFTQTYTGSPLPVTATTVPSGLTVNITYTGVSGTTYGPSTVAPTAVGTYAVAANISDPKHTGTATGTLVINKATPTITWNAPAAITYGTALTNAHLAARSPVTGSYVYTPALGQCRRQDRKHCLSPSRRPTLPTTPARQLPSH